METPNLQVEAPASPRFKSYHHFFDYYLSHNRPTLAKGMHYVASAIGAVSLLIAIWDGKPMALVAGIVIGYALAWIAHSFVERNDAGNIIQPFWALLADYHMVFLKLTGQLDARRRAAFHDHDYRP
jgi:hypothetical protein